MSKNALSLWWPGKQASLPACSYRLVERPAYSAAAPHAPDSCDNRIIHGDNLAALSALEAEFAGRIRCVYLDPPYNRGADAAHYADSREHPGWLSMMRDRLIVLKRLLRPDGVLFVHIDDSESAYLKVLLDEIFGREQHLVTLYVQVRYPAKTLKEDMLFNKVIEQIHCYGGGDSACIYRQEEDYDFSKFRWHFRETGPPRALSFGGKRVELFPPEAYVLEKRDPSPQGLKEIWASGTILDGNSSGRFFRDFLQGRSGQDGLGALYKVYGIGDDGLGYRYFTGPKRKGATKGKYYQGVPQSAASSPIRKKPISNFIDLAAAFGNCRHEGGVEFRSGKKPEALLRWLLQMATQQGDWVLDAFAGSGTTGAVAHKLGRKWILIESEKQCRTHIHKRLQAVASGTDPTGISKAVHWQGGGGFRYYDVVADQ